MADYEFPDELLKAQRAYYEADAKVQKLADALPSSVEVLAGTAFEDEEQRIAVADTRAQLEEARAERLAIIDVLYGDEYWTKVDDQHAARMALQKAAKSALQQAQG